MLSAEDVEQVRFKSTKFREGYDQGQVNDLLGRVVATLRRDPSQPAVTADGVRKARFASIKFHEGYDQDEVDAFLDRVIETLKELDRYPTSTMPASAPAPDYGTPAPPVYQHTIPAPPADAPTSDIPSQLERLAQLHTAGALTDTQYEAAKDAVIHGR